MTKMSRLVFAFVCGVAVVFISVMVAGNISAAGADDVRWDIISLGFTTPPTFNAGGFADATAPNNGGRIRLSGFGNFVAPAGNGGGSNAVTGGGTWHTFNPAGALTGNGTYVVRELVRWEFAGLQVGTFNDNIGDTAQRANGHAYLRIDYSDGSQGVLGVFCHGPGAPNGIPEGISATKGVVAYTEVGAPPPGVDLNRTVFHILK